MWEPPVDIFETRDKLFIRVALPGVDPDDISVIVDNDTLAVVGERPLAARGQCRHPAHGNSPWSF